MHKAIETAATNAEHPIDIDAAASILNLKRSTVYALTSKRKIPHYKRGGKLYFRTSELLAWLMEGKRDVIDAHAADDHLRNVRGGR